MKRVRAIFGMTWWLILFGAIGSAIVWIVAEPWVGCFMFPTTLALIMYFAYVRLDKDGKPRAGIDG
jgi:hypothetical protein